MGPKLTMLLQSAFASFLSESVWFLFFAQNVPVVDVCLVARCIEPDSGEAGLRTSIVQQLLQILPGSTE